VVEVWQALACLVNAVIGVDPLADRIFAADVVLVLAWLLWYRTIAPMPQWLSVSVCLALAHPRVDAMPALLRPVLEARSLGELGGGRTLIDIHGTVRSSEAVRACAVVLVYQVRAVGFELAGLKLLCIRCRILARVILVLAWTGCALVYIGLAVVSGETCKTIALIDSFGDGGVDVRLSALPICLAWG